MTLRARIGDVQPRRGLRDTPTGTARHPQLEIGGEPKVTQQTKVATNISSTTASIENLLLVQGEPSACMCKVSCLHMAWPPTPFVMIWSSN